MREGADMAKTFLKKQSSFPEIPLVFWQTFNDLSKCALTGKKMVLPKLEGKSDVDSGLIAIETANASASSGNIRNTCHAFT